jgi:hypothetical protein
MLQFTAKVVAAFRRIYMERLRTHDILAKTDFKEYLKQNAGGEVPGRVLALSSLFDTLVVTLVNGKSMLSEDFFDSAKVDWLEKANAIIAAERKAHPDNWKTSDNVLDVINALSKPGDAGKTLKEVRKRQKGEPTNPNEIGETAEAAQPLTVGRAVEYLIAAIKNAGKMPASEAADLFEATVRVNDAWAESGVADDDLNRWSKNIANGVAVNLEIIKPKPAVSDPQIAALVAA